MASELWLPGNPDGGLGADWRDDAASRGCDPELFFPDTGATAHARAQISTAKRVCRRCPVTLTCLTWALASGQAASGEAPPNTNGTGSAAACARQAAEGSPDECRGAGQTRSA
jgi:hypothetical protein